MSKEKSVYTPYEGPAGGWGALKSTARFWMKSENRIHNIKSLLKTNQEDGFDCPGCAWGDKQDPAKFKFCENGAKAVNWEATSKQVTAEFFAQYPVSWEQAFALIGNTLKGLASPDEL